MCFYWIIKSSGTVLGPCCYMALHLTKTQLEKIQLRSGPVESSTRPRETAALRQQQLKTPHTTDIPASETTATYFTCNETHSSFQVVFT